MNSKDLKTIGFEEGKSFGMTLQYIAQKIKEEADTVSLKETLTELKSRPEKFLNEPELAEIATQIISEMKNKSQAVELIENPMNHVQFGETHIEAGASEQMKTAMKLPVTVAGALMPDAHQGYGLPIGGVLATRNAIIPYGVGVDIGCRMALSILDLPVNMLNEGHDKLKRELLAQTLFGAGKFFKREELAEHKVLYRNEFQINSFIRALRDKAIQQLGSSGGGNHFVEFGILEFDRRDKEMNIDAGQYLALLTHSGSRGLGASIAGEYTKIAKSLCRLPSEAANLAFLDLNSEAGAEYWALMNLAGDYASACHEVIHNKLVKSLGAEVIAKVENHHNFAWKENHMGEDLIVHRKGATPASMGSLGFIPGSMATPGFLVRGKGNASSLHSASHGAGRLMSRTRAINSIKREDFKTLLKNEGITLIGGGLDEAPQAYKNIHEVMMAQSELVDPIAAFYPKIVRMADDGSKED